MAREGSSMALVCALAATVPGEPVTLDVPETNGKFASLLGELGLVPVSDNARMYTGDAPDVELSGLFAGASGELG